MEEEGVWEDPKQTIAPSVLEEFGGLVAGSARPIDDVRGTAAYRRHACAVLARRALRWALDDRRAAANGGHL
jgi:CO/xanthine dehydrogenase FAD-binding subunit